MTLGGIELLNPKGLWLLTGLVPLIALYILKIRRRRVKVSSTWLWTSAQRDLLAKHPFRKLVAELPLILQILALIALSIALARPSLRGNKLAGDHVAIVIDASASMGTLVEGAPAGTTRMALAKKAAADAIASLSPGADAIVLEAAKEARVVSPLDRDERRLKAAVAQVDVREVEGDLAGAVALAAERLRSLDGKKQVLVITDGALARDTPLAANGASLQVVTVGGDADNAGIVRIDVRTGADPTTKRDQVQVFAMVKNYAARPRDAYVTLSLEGRTDPIASRRVLVPPNDKTPVVLTFEPKPSDQGAALTVQLSPGDALPLDDVAYGRVPAGMKMPVVLASDLPYSWVQRALESDPNVDVQKLSTAQLATVNVDPDALVVVDGACPKEAPGRDVMIVAPPEGTCFAIDVGNTVENPQLTSWESGDPRLRFLSFDGVLVAKTAQLKAQGANASLVRTSNSTLIADATVPGRTITIVGFDVGDSNWPLKASFVLFVRNVVELARLHRAQGIAGPARTGEVLRVPVPTGTEKVTFSAPGAPDRELPVKVGFVVIPPLDRAGIYKLRWTSPHVGGALVAANLTSERESDVRPRAVQADAGGGNATALPAHKIPESPNEWGPWLALLAAIVIALDVWWLTRAPKKPTAIAGGAR